MLIKSEIHFEVSAGQILALGRSFVAHRLGEIIEQEAY